jgi:hypothetical protein
MFDVQVLTRCRRRQLRAIEPPAMQTTGFLECSNDAPKSGFPNFFQFVYLRYALGGNPDAQQFVISRDERRISAKSTQPNGARDDWQTPESD